MARTLAELPQGARITDYVSLGVIAKTFPGAKVQAVRRQKGKTSRRRRDLPAPGVVDDVIALALYRQVSYGEVPRCLREGIAWLRGPSEPPRVSGESGISQARSRLGAGPLEQLRDELARPVLVDAQQQCLVRRVPVQADDVGEFVDELGIAGNLEGLDAMRLETMGVPDALHGRRRDALRAGHGAATPRSRVDGLCGQRGVDDRADFLSADRGFAAASGAHPS